MRVVKLILALAGTSTVFSAPANTSLIINYSNVVDGRAVTHSGETVDSALDELRDSATKGPSLSRREIEAQISKLISTRGALTDASRKPLIASLRLTDAKSLVEPYLEPCTFVLEDLLEATDSSTVRPDLIEVASLFPSGEEQPAWADLLRTRYYYVLSNGAGYARFFIPGDDAAQAWREHLPVLRYVVQFLLASQKQPALALDVYAYRNDYAKQELRLALPKASLSYSGIPPSGAGRPALNLTGIADFLAKGMTIEGASLDERGQLVLIGSAGAQRPTLEGQPVTLADLATAYRAVFYAGEGAPYMSLDRSENIEETKVNFGGRLQDTRLGWVALRADMRFKTISDGYDPITGDDLSAGIARRVAGFMTQEKREKATPENQQPDTEFTRFWYYPDNISVAESGDGKRMKIQSPRYTAAAEREFSWGDPAMKTPPWTKAAIDHLNTHYDAYAAMFPEIRELDTEGRLLSLFSWLRQKKLAGAEMADLDSLLAVELPRCATPRRLPQMLVAYFAGEQSTLLSENVSDLAERLVAQRREGNSELTISDFLDDRTEAQDRLMGQIVDLGRERAMKRQPAPAKSMEEFDQKFDEASVITGGLDLAPDPLKSHRNVLTPADDAGLLNVLNAPREGVTTGGLRWEPSRDASPFVFRAAPKPHAAETRAAGIHVATQVSQNDKLESSLQVVESTASDGTARLASYSSVGKLSTEARVEEGRSFVYNVKATSAGYSIDPVERAAPVSFAGLEQAIRKSSAGAEMWSAVPASSSISGADMTADGRVAILFEDKEGPVLRYSRDGTPPTVVHGDAALKEFESIGQARAKSASTSSLKFVFASGLDADDVTLQVGDRQVVIDADDLSDLLDNPLRNDVDLPPGLFQPGGEYVIYRDSLDRRPAVNGGSEREGTPTNPLRLAETLQQRFPGSHFYLDDEPALAVRNHSSLAGIKGPEDVVTLAPEQSFAVQDWGLLKLIRGYLKTAGIREASTGADLASTPNVLLISGDNDEGLAKYLIDLGEKGYLKDHVLLLNTCYARQNPNFFSELLARYSPSAIYTYSDYVHVDALQRMVRELGPMLAEARTSNRPIAPADLLRNAVNRALADSTLSPKLRLHLEMLQKGVLQISRAQPAPMERERSGRVTANG